MGPRDIDVLDFGADLTGTFDSTTPIQNAIDYLVSFGGGTLYFPTGNYKITQTLIYNGNLGNSIHFKGALGNAITGAQLIWYGANRGGPMMTCTTLTGDTFSHLSFFGTLDGLNGPQYTFWVRETPNPKGGGSPRARRPRPTQSTRWGLSPRHF